MNGQIPENKSHIAVIDTLRGIAALMVVIVHISMRLEPSWLTMIASYGQHGVIIFLQSLALLSLILYGKVIIVTEHFLIFC